MDGSKYKTMPEARYLARNRHTMMTQRGGNPFGRLLASGTTLIPSPSRIAISHPKEPIDNEGSLSSGYGGYYCDNGINIAILALTLAGLAAMFWILYTKITMLVGRKRRHAEEYNTPVQNLPYTYTYNIKDTISEIYWGRI